MSSSLASTGGSAKLQTAGTILYNPSNVKLMGSMGPEWGHFTVEEADLLKNNGANCLAEIIYPAWWQSNETNPYSGEAYQAKHLQMRQWLKDRSIKYCMSLTGTWDWAPTEGWDNAKMEVVLNVSGLQDKWIADVGAIIQALQPDIVTPMGEPPYYIADTVYNGTITQDQYVQTYRQFCIRAINAWRAIKPDLIGMVYSVPWWYLQVLAANPIPLPNIIYPMELWYSYDGTYPSEAWSQAYWKGSANAKSLLLDKLGGLGIDEAISAGLTVIWEEVGANLAAPNALAFMQDIYDYSKSMNVGVLQGEFRGNPPYDAGILNSNWLTLNQMGLVWARNMQG